MARPSGNGSDGGKNLLAAPSGRIIMHQEREFRDIFSDLDRKGVRRIIVAFSDLNGGLYHPYLLYDGSLKDKERIASELGIGIKNSLLPTDGSSFKGFDLDTSFSDMVIKADMPTFRIWERRERNPDGQLVTENIGFVWADIINPDGTPYSCCPRTILKRAVDKAAGHGLIFTAGSEQEFFVSRKEGTLHPIDTDGYYQTVPVWLSEVAFTLRKRGIETEYFHHEVAPGQFEIRTKYKTALEKADDILVYKMTLRETAALYGISITFMPKPQDGINGSGMHVHWGINDLKRNFIMAQKNKHGFSPEGKRVIAALLHHACESSIVYNSSINSYRRLKPGYEAPTVVCWGSSNRTAMFRKPAEGTRIENRVLDGVGSPHIKFAVMIEASLRGYLDHSGKYKLPEPVTENVFHSDIVERRHLVAVPQTIRAAIGAAQGSDFLKTALGERAYSSFIKIRKKELAAYDGKLSSLRGEARDVKALGLECELYWNS